MRTTHKVEVYRADDGWRWRIRAANGNVVAESGEAYHRRGALRRSLWALAVGFACHTVRIKEVAK